MKLVSNHILIKIFQSLTERRLPHTYNICFLETHQKVFYNMQLPVSQSCGFLAFTEKQRKVTI